MSDSSPRKAGRHPDQRLGMTGRHEWQENGREALFFNQDEEGGTRE
ncbi:hypothetical protein BN871_JK_00050 [Paenibacillus sp. P22]|nr:hypothetical protein BN871_JK_00050 [Paenibacillus sp. P22]